ncbi:MAG TPA: Ig-like domain-containing protein [Actinoplanes sp.]|jgi:lipoprotein-anchoring transpeptidase ErfK/SrfK
MRATESAVALTGARRPWRTAAAALVAGAVLLTGACSGDEKSPSWQGGGQAQGQPGDAPRASPAPAEPQTTALITAPAAEAKNVLAATDVQFSTENGEEATIEVKDEDGKAVKGAVLPGEKTWRPDKQLQYGTTYTATVTTSSADGKTGPRSSTFTTMPKPSKLVRVTSFLGDGQTVGVGMPMIVQFGQSVPSKYRADVQRRMTVKTTPEQVGIWHWVSPKEIHYRPRTYWKPNTKIFYKVQLGGVKMADDAYGRSDFTVDLKTGRALVMTVDNKTKKMTVTRNGKTIKTIPVSLGKPKTPSSSGTMIVMEKKRKTVFDTRAELGPEEGYRTDIDYAQRITWSGQFIHAAPWSEGDQGTRNVSHGCVNVSMSMGAWLFNQTMLGDPITVKGTEEKLQNGNGWTDWNMSWDQYVKGSALPLDA